MVVGYKRLPAKNGSGEWKRIPRLSTGVSETFRAPIGRQAHSAGPPSRGAQLCKPVQPAEFTTGIPPCVSTIKAIVKSQLEALDVTYGNCDG